MDGALTLFASVEAIVSGHVLDVVDERGLRQQRFVLVDPVDGIFECQFDAAVLLVLGKYRSCDKIQT